MISRAFSILPQFRELLKSYPLELLFTFVVSIVACSFDTYENTPVIARHLVLLSPCFFALIYLSNYHRMGYLFSLLYPIVCSILFGYFNAIEHHFLLLCGVFLIISLLFFTKGFEQDNRKFAHLTLVTVINTAFAGILTGALLLLVLGILGGVEFLFGIEILTAKAYEKVSIFIGMFFSVFFFLMLENRTADYDPKQEGLLYAGDILINWIMSPAVMIYTVIVYAYLVMILFQFELPAGRVSTVILPYIMLGLVCIALRQFSTSPKWQWFYCHFARISLIPLGLLWLGIYERVATYGLTESRIYLIAIACLVSFFILCSLTEKWLQYRLFNVATMVVIAVVTMVFSPTQLSIESQHKRFVGVLKKYDALDEQGKIREAFLNRDNIVQNEGDRRTLRSALAYLHSEITKTYGHEQIDMLRTRLYEEKSIEERVKEEEELRDRVFVSADQEIDLKGYRKFYSLADYQHYFRYMDGDEKDISLISFLSYEDGGDKQTTKFTINQSVITQILQQNGIQHGKMYKWKELEPVMEKMLLLPTNEGVVLVLREITLTYSPTHQHYIFNDARVSGYLVR